jgi:hypothetical protein
VAARHDFSQLFQRAEPRLTSGGRAASSESKALFGQREAQAAH